MAKDLVERYAAKAKEQEWRKTKAADWINESHAIAETFVYRDLEGFSCGADMAGQRIELSTAYVTKAEAIVDEQLAKAGYRLPLEDRCRVEIDTNQFANDRVLVGVCLETQGTTSVSLDDFQHASLHEHAL